MDFNLTLILYSILVFIIGGIIGSWIFAKIAIKAANAIKKASGGNNDEE